MKFLFTTNPGLGHVNPMLPVADRLKLQGHDVMFATALSFCPTIEAKGFRAVPVGLDWLESEVEKAFPEAQSLSLEDRSTWFLSDIFADAAAHQFAIDAIDVCRSWQPDVVVRNDYEFGGYIAAESLGIPHATLSVSFFMPESQLETLIGDQIAFLRSLHGLSPYPALDRIYHYLYLVLGPPSCQPLDLPIMHPIRPTVFKGDIAEGLPAWIHELPDQPTVYASLGTVFNRTPDVFPAILEAFHDESINLIMTIGRNQDLKQFGVQPEHIHIEHFIPQLLLFPHCDLFITHTSFYTITSALKFGIPLLMIPLSADEPINALRGMELGIGLVLKRPGTFDHLLDASIPVITPDSVKTTVHTILHNPQYRTQAARIQADIEALPDPSYAASLLIQLAERQEPVLR